MHKYYSELVELIYAIPLKKDGWAVFSKRLKDILNVTAVNITAMDLTRQAISFSQFESIFPAEEIASAEIKHLHCAIEEDPRWQHFFQNAQGWYKSDDYISEDFVSNSEFYQKYLLPFQVRYTIAQALILDDKLCVLIGIHSCYKRGQLNAQELLFLDELLVHLRRVTNFQRHIFEFSESTIVGYDLVDKVSQPIMLIHLNGDVAHQNLFMKDLIKKTNLFTVDQKKLVFVEPHHTAFMMNLQNLELLYKEKYLNTAEKIDDFFMRIKDEQGEKLYIFASLLASEREIRAFGVRPHVILTMYHASYSALLDFDMLKTLFGITPAEFKVALLLLEGYVPKEIAHEHEVNLDTIRKQLHSIYKKTSTKRQSDLVKLLLNMPRYKGN